ncbi:MAG: LTA synthase family protein [Bacteroidales bacterium]|jgi:phosphoglycerol transferase MdoB-like AlkP superfamily enzyme|nr:LTA synthase family protein [Bacteroidales bacterium]
MKIKRLLLILYYFIFWLVFFEISRLFFILYNFSELGDDCVTELFASFYYGFPLDLSITSYIVFPSILIFIISAFIRNEKFLRYTLSIYTGIVIFIISLIIIGDAETYSHWAFRLDKTPLQFISTPETIIGNVSTIRLILLFLVYFIFVGISGFLYYKMVFNKMKKIYLEKFYSLFYILLFGILFISIRGGVGTVSINVGTAYYSQNSFCNNSAINVVWNFFSSLLNEDINYDDFKYFDDNKVNMLFQELHQSEDTTINVLGDKTPENVIFIVLESFTADAVGCLGGENLTPNIDKWSKQGILFNNFYANTDRSDKALVAIFSSMPVLLNNSLMKHPEKSKKLPSIINKLVEKGYSSSYYYGGDVNFANMNSYMHNINFQKIYSQNNLKLNCIADSKWGYHDECMLDLLYQDFEKSQGKNIFALFTLSSHEPYEVPSINKFLPTDEMNKARNSYIYTDSCLNVFLEKIQKSSKWKNTLIILVSDHGTRFPGNKEVWEKSKYKALMLWLGGALKSNPFIYNNLADDLDISKTLLSQMNLEINTDDFIFSENLFEKKNTSTFYSFASGFGFLKNNDWIIYDINSNSVIQKNGDDENMENYSKAYMQKLSEYYKSLE